jgi:phosphatidylglycerophosphatase A
MTPSTEPNPAVASPAAQKPRLAFGIATALGVGYLKPGPGTWGSAVGLLFAVLCHPFTWLVLILPFVSSGGLGYDTPMINGHPVPTLLLVPSIAAWILVASLGVWSSSRVARFAGVGDPQFVVIDEVSGVHLSLILALVPMGGPISLLHPEDAAAFALFTGMSILNWKYLLAAFLVFRVFDIAKPFPCRRLEKLPGGWGIMADDWMAGVYAAICLRLALHFHLL